MTKAEFLELVNEHYLIVCSTTAERNMVLQFLKDNGYRLGSASRSYLSDNPEAGSNFLCPRFYGDSVSNYRSIPSGEDTILFSEIEKLLCGEEELDDSDENPEFISWFYTLINA